jgi:hypothetical protein
MSENAGMRPPVRIQSDLRDLFLIDVPENALADVRARLIPAGQLLRELEESGDVAAHGGWKRYAASGDLEKNTAIKGRSHTLVYSYLTVAHFGLEAFENALRRAAHENVEFASHSGLDWAVEVVRFGQGKKPKVLAAAAAAAKSETFSRVSGVPDPSKSKAITRIRQLEDIVFRLLAEQRKIVAAGVWSDRLLRQIEREMGETTFPVVAADERPPETSQAGPLLNPTSERETSDPDPSPVLRPIAGAPPGAPVPPWPP